MKKIHEEVTVTGVVVDEKTTFSITEICRKYTISEEELFELIEHGLFKTISKKITNLDIKAIHRLESALRLQRDLGVNAPGAVLAIELSDELEHLRNELEFLRQLLEE